MKHLFLCMAIALTTFASAAANPDLETRLRQFGFVDVAELDSTLIVDLMYASKNNFVGEVMYTSLSKAYLHPRAAKALVVASKELRKINPSLRLKVCDAARPMSVQRHMFRSVQGTPKARYVANPAKGGGLHNYGMAVDITIVDSQGRELPMGTCVDHLGPEANIDRERELVRTGVISEQELQNRLLLRRVMKAAGFKPLRTEWWHFNFVTKAEARANYRRLDF